jgi:hypothetical protein
MKIQYMKKIGVHLIFCVVSSLVGCTSYVVIGNWGGPTGGGVLSPDGKSKAFVKIAVSDRYELGALSPHIVTMWISDGTSHAITSEKKEIVQSYYVWSNIVWRDSNTVDYDFFDYGSSVEGPPITRKLGPQELKRELGKFTLRKN